MRVLLFEYICHCCSASWLMAACLFLNDGCEENFSEVTVNSINFYYCGRKGKKQTRDVLLRYLCWLAVIAVYLPPSESVGCRSNRRSFKRSFLQESHHSCSLTRRWNQSRLQNAAKSDAAGENPWFLTHLEKYELTPVFFFLSPEIREKQVGKPFAPECYRD